MKTIKLPLYKESNTLGNDTEYVEINLKYVATQYLQPLNEYEHTNIDGILYNSVLVFGMCHGEKVYCYAVRPLL